ncbi:hypothetical protein KBY81_15090 [Cyanobium sp. Lug-B]|nr:hypothetical protein [Cyanobium sp. Lug-B]
MPTQTIEDVIESWIADRRLSRRQKAFLNEVYDRREVAEAASFNLCPRFEATELDVPEATYWIQLVATVLDFEDPREGVVRYDEVTQELEDYGHLSD